VLFSFEGGGEGTSLAHPERQQRTGHSTVPTNNACLTRPPTPPPTPHPPTRPQEQRIFDLPHAHKLASCAHLKRTGNLYVREGAWARALDRYRRALVYYEYAFPDTAEEQASLDRVRLQCLLNSALCDVRLGRWEEAVLHSTQALEIDPDCAKAFFRRAVARRRRMDHEGAAADLAAASRLAPGDDAVRVEREELSRAVRAYKVRSARMARTMLGLGDDGRRGKGGGEGGSEPPPLLPPGVDGVDEEEGGVEAGSHAADTLSAPSPLNAPDDDDDGGDIDEEEGEGGAGVGPGRGVPGRPAPLVMPGTTAELLRL
jgi:hypothetical protein